MAKTTRKKKESETSTPVTDKDVKEFKKNAIDALHDTGQPAEVLTAQTNDTATSLIVSPQEQEPQTVIPASQQPENPVSADPGANGAGQQTATPAVTYEVVEAKFRMELTRLSYEQALQALTSYEITEENIAEAQNRLTRARRFITKMDDIKSNGKAPAWEECKFWDRAFNSIKKPLEDAIAVKQAKLNEVAAEQARKKKKEDDEKERVDNIKAAIDNFIIQQSQAIAGCKTNAELVNIQKMIGSHKAAKTRYEEFLPDLVARCEPLNDLIKEQKKTIDALEKLEKEKLEAEAKGDDGTLIALEDKKDELMSKMAETKVVVQETAINQATKSESVQAARPVYNTISARRTTWKAELTRSTRPEGKPGEGELDKKELEKALKAGLLVCTPNTEKIRDVLATLKDTGALKDKKEVIVNGIRYYEEKIY